MRRWFSERLDNAMFPVLKVLSPGYRQRLLPFRPPGECDLAQFDHLGAPGEVTLQTFQPWDGFGLEQFSFPSPLGCSCQENQTVAGRTLLVDSAAPWVLIVPGYATGGASGAGYGLFQTVQARYLLKRGLNVALIDLPYHVSRRRQGCHSGEGFYSADLAETMANSVQAAADVIQTTRWLQARSGRPVGLWGTSMGGHVAGLACTRMADPAALVLMEPMDNPGDVLATLPGAREVLDGVLAGGLTAAEMTEALRVVAPSSYPPALPLEQILFLTPLWDRVVETRFQEAFWEAWGRPQRISKAAGHITMAYDAATNITAADFLARQLLNRTS